MFVSRSKAKKAEDFTFPENLDALGLVHTEKDEIRQKADQTQKFDFYHFGRNNARRKNLLRRLVVDRYVEKWTLDQFLSLGFETLSIPQVASADEPHVNILVTPNWRDHSTQLLVILPGVGCDLGQWSTRASIDESMRSGSMLPMITSALEVGFEIMILNPAQWIWDPKGKTAVNDERFEGICEGGEKKLRKENEIPQGVEGKTGVEGHIDAVFGPGGVLRMELEKELQKSEEGRQIYCLALGYGAGYLVELWDRDWDGFWAWYLHAAVLVEPAFSRKTLGSTSFKKWLLTRCRTYITHASLPAHTFAEGDFRFGTSVYSGGSTYMNDIPRLCWEEFMKYFDLAWREPEGCNPEVMFEIEGADGAGGEGDLEGEEGRKRIEEGLLFVKRGDQFSATVESGWEDIERLG